ncbi:MAG: hypothetical protein V1649_04795 [Patescibacteria group bacterium]
MKEKKQSKEWYIAATHWLTAGLAMPFLLTLILGIPAALVIGKDNIALLTVVMSAIWILSLWLGVMYSAKYLAKTYIIKNSDNIIRLAAIYLAVLGGGFRLIGLSKGITLASMIDLGFFVVGVAVFYILSKKYVKNTDDAIVPQQ